MPRVVAYEAAKAHQVKRKHDVRIPFLNSSADTPDLPSAFLSQGFLGKVIGPHWHAIDQFQVIIEGKGKLGRKDIAAYSVQFVRAYTPYGPLMDDGETAVSFLTLRACFDPPVPGTRSGANFLPESLHRLKQVPDRHPWQITRHVTFPSQHGSAIPSAVNLQDVPDITDDQGLFTYALTMPPNSRTVAPDPSLGDGQFLLIVKGSLRYESKEHKALTIAFVEPGERPFEVHAGAEGLEGIIMNFPRTKIRRAMKTAPHVTSDFKKWQCELCAFAYDEAVGLPEDGIPAGTRWEDVPQSWTCPDCSASKNDFRTVEVIG